MVQYNQPKCQDVAKKNQVQHTDLRYQSLVNSKCAPEIDDLDHCTAKPSRSRFTLNCKEQRNSFRNCQQRVLEKYGYLTEKKDARSEDSIYSRNSARRYRSYEPMDENARDQLKETIVSNAPVETNKLLKTSDSETTTHPPSLAESARNKVAYDFTLIDQDRLTLDYYANNAEGLIFQQSMKNPPPV